MITKKYLDNSQNQLHIERLQMLEARKGARWQHYLVDSLLAIAGSLLITCLIAVFHLYPKIPNISLVYLLIVLALASTRGLYAAILASVVAFLSFDFFLVPPLYTFSIYRFEEWLALFIFLTTAIITGELASIMRQRAEQASRRARETRILYDLVRATNSEQDLDRQLEIVANAIVDVFSSWGIRGCGIILPSTNGQLRLQASTQQEGLQLELSRDEVATASWVMAQAQTVELHDVPLAPQGITKNAPRAIVRSSMSPQPLRRYMRMIPLKMGQNVVGVVRLLIEDDPRLFGKENVLGVDRERSSPQTAFFWTFLDQATTVIERIRLRRESLQVEVLQRTDELRAALLSSVSHDLRTPLSSIKASASSLLEEDVQWDEETRRSFALAIEQEADRLNRLVGNLLDMSRIEGGALKPEKEWFPLDELVHDVLSHMQPLLHGRTVLVDIPEDLPPVEIDYLQMDQVLTNLVENAVYYSPFQSTIELSARVERDTMMISVADRGPGIPVSDRTHIFDKFYRVLGQQRQTRTGSGLGLAVCKGLVEAHGGSIWMENRAGGGSVFRFTLPVGKAAVMGATEDMQR
jgi:two-component system sensor histidine kinase KdpD